MSSSNAPAPELWALDRFFLPRPLADMATFRSSPGSATVTEYHRGEQVYTVDPVKEKENNKPATERQPPQATATA